VSSEYICYHGISSFAALQLSKVLQLSKALAKGGEPPINQKYQCWKWVPLLERGKLSAMGSSSASVTGGSGYLAGTGKNCSQAKSLCILLEAGISAFNWKPSLVQQPVPLHPCGKWVSWLNVEYELSTTASSSASLREVGI